jgi:hypothetical protein
MIAFAHGCCVVICNWFGFNAIIVFHTHLIELSFKFAVIFKDKKLRPRVTTAIDLLKVNDFFILSFSYLSFNRHFLASKGRFIQISGGICANLHTIADLVGGTAVDTSSELHES